MIIYWQVLHMYVAPVIYFILFPSLSLSLSLPHSVKHATSSECHIFSESQHAFKES